MRKHYIEVDTEEGVKTAEIDSETGDLVRAYKRIDSLTQSLIDQNVLWCRIAEGKPSKAAIALLAAGARIANVLGWSIDDVMEITASHFEMHGAARDVSALANELATLDDDDGDAHFD